MFRSPLKLLLSVSALTALAPLLWPKASWAQPPNLQQLAQNTQRTTLDNGLRVVMNVDHNSPSVAICVTYDVGSRNEQVGKSGFAHLFEHMMFQGSGHVKKGEHFTWITAKGGTLNGTTSSDRTNYFELLPSSSLDLGLWLEADRMKSLDVSQANFENQRKVVQEEYRMRVSNAPYAMGGIKLQELVFGDYWPYAHPPIGSMADLDAAKLEWIREFHGQYYAPNNAVLTIAGDFDTDQAVALVKRYFGDAKRSQVPAYQPPAAVAAQTAPRNLTVPDSAAHTPGLMWGWAIPENRTPEHYALELATLVLAGGESSRLHQLLVRDKSWAQSVNAWTGDNRGPDILVLKVILSEQGKVKDVTRIVDQEVERLARSGPSAAELEKAKNQLVSYFLFGLEGNMARAQQLANYELFYGDARLLSKEVDEYMKVNATELQSAVSKYLTAARRNRVTIEPATAPATPAPAAPAPAAPAPAGQAKP
jgi:predicted Zn-dependent peptidase